jgi:hypothetical protein
MAVYIPVIHTWYTISNKHGDQCKPIVTAASHEATEAIGDLPRALVRTQCQKQARINKQADLVALFLVLEHGVALLLKLISSRWIC